MTRHRRSQPPDIAPAVMAEVARLATAVEALAATVIEVRADVAELHAMRRRKAAAPAGLVPLKAAVAMTTLSYETCRRWCVRCGAEIGAVRVGGFWFVDAAALAAKSVRV
jgi:hypothetical protein